MILQTPSAIGSCTDADTKRPPGAVTDVTSFTHTVTLEGSRALGEPRVPSSPSRLYALLLYVIIIRFHEKAMVKEMEKQNLLNPMPRY